MKRSIRILFAAVFMLLSMIPGARAQQMNESYDSLWINNVNAMFNAGNNNFFFEIPRFEVPKFSGTSTIFLNTLWIGGITGDSTLCLAAMRYGQGPTGNPALTKFDFFPGPVMDSAAYSVQTDSAWNYIWNVTKAEVEYHKLHWNDAGYQPVHDILYWPGNGNPALGQASTLAPYFDANGDGHYNAMQGDYPLIKGDQSLFYIFNDDRKPHAETQGNKMKIEVHAMAYAFDIPEDTAFNNTVFLNYTIYNRSQKNYRDVYIGHFTDFDIGFANDDYVGSDVERSSYYGYNGDPIDGTGLPGTYGAHPPAQGVTVLSGPLMDPDGADNPRFDGQGNQLCNESVNGTGFGDTIVDNERLGLSGFIYINNSNSGVPAYMTDPLYAPEYYNTLRGIWKDGTHLIYGGNGHPSTGGYGPACNFMFPGSSDPLYWGLGCQQPGGPPIWTEATTGNNPSDRRAVGSSGPFTLIAGEEQNIEIAFTWARAYTGTPWESVGVLQRMIDTIRTAYMLNRLPGGGSFNGTGDQPTAAKTIRIYPNPAKDRITVSLTAAVFEPVTVQIFSTRGVQVFSQVVNPAGNKIYLDLSGFGNGLYFIRIQSTSLSGVAKLSVLR